MYSICKIDRSLIEFLPIIYKKKQKTYQNKSPAYALFVVKKIYASFFSTGFLGAGFLGTTFFPVMIPFGHLPAHNPHPTHLS